MTKERVQTSMARLLEAARRAYVSTPALVDFAPWPDDLVETDLGHQDIPAEPIIEAFGEPGTDLTEPVIQAIRHCVPDAFWIQTYTEEEVGRDFLNRYGYFELFGPTGHFITNRLRGYAAYWGNGLDYGWHNHKAEEIYFCLAGEGLFKAEGEEDCSVTAGETKYHASNQMHAMTTSAQPFLCLAFWRGDGMGDLPKMAS